MKKIINKDLTLYFSKNFPYKNSSISDKIHIVTLGIGGNIRNVKKTFDKLFISLKNDSRFTIIKTSPILKNPPFGYVNQNYFLNSIIVLSTSLSPNFLLNELKRYEIRFKRKRLFKDSPRTLDIDIIFYDNISMQTKNLTIPHMHWHERNSVIIPLEYI